MKLILINSTYYLILIMEAVISTPNWVTTVHPPLKKKIKKIEEEIKVNEMMYTPHRFNENYVDPLLLFIYSSFPK